MQEVDYSPEISAYLSNLKAVGCVVDLAVVTYPHWDSKPVFDPYAISKKAALAGMRIFQKRYENRFIQLNPGKDIRSYFNVRITGEPVGRQISMDTFLGPFYDFFSSSLLPFQDSAPKPIYWLYARGMQDGDAVTYGFVDAMLDPPYSLRSSMQTGQSLRDQEQTDIITFFLEKFLYVDVAHHCLEEPLFIVAWSDDWSTYFEAGKDWWGAFFWTMLIPGKEEVVVVGASASD